MQDKIKVNKSMNTTSNMNPGVPSEHMPSSHGNSKLPWVILVLVVIILAGAGFLLRDKLFTSSSKDKTEAVMTKASGYQAVFLTNGQVYFGKLSDASSDYVTVKDIYYLQVTQPPLQGSQQSQAQAQAQAQAQPQLSLVKLGNELHGPVDEMKINRTQILFYEDMKENAKVMEAIKQYKANPDAANTQTPTTPTTPTK